MDWRDETPTVSHIEFCSELILEMSNDNQENSKMATMQFQNHAM
jgi:hypothetical protein